jgi:malonyl-ACP decarboxylase
MKQPISITGLGAIGSFGIGVNSLLQALQQGINAISLSQQYPELSFALLQAELKCFTLADALQRLAIPAKLTAATMQSLRRSSLVVQAGVCAALEAWQQSKLRERIAPDKIGLIVAGHNTTSFEQYRLQKDLATELNFISPAYALNFMDSQQLSAISEVLGIQGPGLTIGGASASSHAALWQAYQWLKYGQVEACLVVGSLAQLAPLELQALYNLGALGGQSFIEHPQQACRPFDTAHEGFIPGQAAACVILEGTAASINSQAELIATALGLDANHLTNPSVTGEIKVMQQALAEAKLVPEDIDYINAHATSTPLGDEVELQAIEQVFGEHAPAIWVNSTKSITGHCLWSAGLIETIATILQLQKQFVHANVNLTTPLTTRCKLVGQQASSAKLKRAMNNGFGFGGINASLILQRGSI